MDLKSKIRNIPDFPVKGIQFKDITTLLKDKEAYKYCIDSITEHCKSLNIDYIAGIEARGFIIGAPVAYNLNIGFLLIRKKGRLPADVESISYKLEYGENILEIHRDAFKKDDRIMVIDDLLATGGTTLAVFKLIEKLNGKVVGADFIVELEMLHGREKLKGYDVFSLVKYEA
ncbi:MAG: adenine phosphoribosyltransferase [Atribacterota bacterium]|jgi:adenine phosphoribosyltransferase|nr:adenine phosphoribosyltransferase [Atribacterota bacterium]MDD3640463.1 adenine phosphoribosyltransferase [Atribacterota bacterium]MDD4288607.1 adenine phosphoribosyltransferase [Atribacterota bacterium]MDD4765694.1 adenine phosphoribosyltransferase [Atribacterota bacterium]MDD5636062.1 adenine phosphoribosyltransferase [Atribacterota bacterium]